ncbi:GNAT family N-acetyltransferase [Sandaracinobacter sp. RS1-74]|uniref:GNAT family N-acetyltransferase n=1 Tax=Sandaracinobacteroides sayramensis TaxID=2913411 RepID=UPI001EDBBA0C|nr:GNAT family N-acetyltransferase [Sandaracinobacteroides sayramensis]MCG2841389.1 GNAT family N-acetyltransferase [Sandaracinobacteroides sayramensis]
MSAEAAPLDHPVRLVTRTGLEFEVRPATEADDALVKQLFRAVSPEDRRFRFLTAREELSDAQVEPITHVDHWRTESFLAFADGEAVATGMLACDKAMETGEVAISIREDRKGRGIGWTLLEFIAGEARRRGVKKLISIESRDNHSAIELEREMGFKARPLADDPTLVVLEAVFEKAQA